jgi:hypothetical protein
MILAMVVTPLHLKPARPLGLVFSNIFLGTSFLSLHGYKRDAGGILAGSCGVYAIMAMRQKLVGRNKWGPRGALRAVGVALCLVNVAAGSTAYVFGTDRIPDEEEEETTEGG